MAGRSRHSCCPLTGHGRQCCPPAPPRANSLSTGTADDRCGATTPSTARSGPELAEPCTEGGGGHSLEVERRVELSEHVLLQPPEAVRVVVWDSDHPEMQSHPLGERLFADRSLGLALRCRREGAPERRKLSPLAEMHADDAGPQGVVRSCATRPARRSRQSGVDQATPEPSTTPPFEPLCQAKEPGRATKCARSTGGSISHRPTDLHLQGTVGSAGNRSGGAGHRAAERFGCREEPIVVRD